MATLTVQAIIEAGLEATYSAASAGGDVMPNDGRTVLHVKNGGGSDVTVTATAQKTSAQVSGYGAMTKANLAVVVTAGEDRFIGPFPPTAFNNASGQVALTYSAVTSVTVAALRLPS